MRRVRTNRHGRRAVRVMVALGLAAGALLGGGAADARAQLLCGLPFMPACPPAPAPAPAPAPEPTVPPAPVPPAPVPAPPVEGPWCARAVVDGNPHDAPVAPALGRPLLPRRGDGRLQWGFAEASFGRGMPAAVGQRLYRRAGATLARVVLDWGAIERERGSLSWGLLDHGYCAALAIGVRPILTLSSIPRWALDPAQPCNSGSVVCRAAPARAAYPALRRFAEAAAIRYPQAAAVEAWNEPNAADFWANPDPARYVEVLREIYTGVKNGRPNMPVLGGALANHQSDLPNGSLGIYGFLEAMYDHGAAGVMDAVSLHPYPVNALGHRYEYFTRTIEGVREIVRRADGPGRRLWLTELGAAAQNTPAPGSAPFSPAGQAALLTGTYDLANEMADVDAIAFHTLSDIVGESRYGWVGLPGLLGARWPKPVYCAFAARFAAPIDCSAPA